jgi:hypothetical protein
MSLGAWRKALQSYSPASPGNNLLHRRGQSNAAPSMTHESGLKGEFQADVELRSVSSSQRKNLHLLGLRLSDQSSCAS